MTTCPYCGNNHGTAHEHCPHCGALCAPPVRTRTAPVLYAPLGTAPVPYQRALYVYAPGTGATHTRAATCAPLGMVRRSGAAWRALCGRPWQARTSAGSTWHRTLRAAVRHLAAPHDPCACGVRCATPCTPPAPLPAHWPLYAAGGHTLALSRAQAVRHMVASGVLA